MAIEKYKRVRPEEMIGEHFGCLTIVEALGKNKYGSYTYKCDCDCGNKGIVASGSALRCGKKSTCGFEHRTRMRILKLATEGIDSQTKTSIMRSMIYTNSEIIKNEKSFDNAKLSVLKRASVDTNLGAEIKGIRDKIEILKSDIRAYKGNDKDLDVVIDYIEANMPEI